MATENITSVSVAAQEPAVDDCRESLWETLLQDAEGCRHHGG